jgi:hypothetical protein
MIIFREIGRVVSLVLSIVSLYALLGSAFFIPGSSWQTRLLGTVETLVMSACVCFASGLLFSMTSEAEPPVTRTLPVRLFLWSLAGMVILFVMSRYLEVYYVPHLWRNQPY